MNTGFLEQQRYLEDLARQPLRLIYCQQMDETSPLWNYAPHSHPCLELICFLSGDLTINRGEDQLDAGASSVVVHPPQALHQEFPRPEGRREVIALWLDGPGPANCGSFQAVDRDGTLRWFFQHIHAEHRRHSADACQLISLYLPALLLHLARACGGGREDALALATRYLRENYSAQSPSLSWRRQPLSAPPISTASFAASSTPPPPPISALSVSRPPRPCCSRRT